MYKVFIENKAVIFISDKNDIPEDGKVYICQPDETTYKSLKKIRTKLKKDILVVVLSEDEKVSWKKFKEDLDIVRAAGGLVESSEGQYLLIFRNGRWDLPKGKLKKKEGKKKGAKREVMEECGVGSLHIDYRINKTYHVIKRSGRAILKKVYWYKMSTDYSGALTPEINEGITEVVWMDRKKASKKLRNTWGTVREVVEDVKL